MKFYELSEAADKDLEEIFDFTNDKFGTEQAIKYLSAFEEVFNNLVLQPETGRERNELKKGLRSISQERHIIFYRVLKDHIRIVRVLHSSRDLPGYL